MASCICFFIVPFLGKKFISFLRYINYSLCEYLNDYGNFLLGNNRGYSSFKEYKRKYERAQEEQRQREREERQRREQEEWERRFNAFNEYFSNQEVSIQAIRDIIKMPVEQVTIHIATLKINLKMLVGF